MGHKWDWGGRSDRFPGGSTATRGIAENEMNVEEDSSV